MRAALPLCVFMCFNLAAGQWPVCHQRWVYTWIRPGLPQYPTAQWTYESCSAYPVFQPACSPNYPQLCAPVPCAGAQWMAYPTREPLEDEAVTFCVQATDGTHYSECVGWISGELAE